MGFKEYVKAKQSFMDTMGTAGTIGLHMVSGPMVGFGLGWLAEWLLNTGTPWPKLIGLLIGIVAGFINVYEDSQRLLKRMRDEDAQKFGPRP